MYKKGNGLAWLIVIIAIVIVLLLVLGGNNEAEPQEQMTFEGLRNIDTEGRTELEGEGAVLVDLLEQNDSGISGLALLQDNGDGTTRVAVVFNGETTSTPRPMHIHTGTCENIADVVYPLESSVDGESETTLDVSLETITAGLPLAINAHESAENPQNYIACGNILNSGELMENVEADGVMENTEIHMVTYTNSGFEPQEITIDRGETVRFINNSNHGMWVASAMHPTHKVYAGTSINEHCPSPDNSAFDQCESVEDASFWEFTFTKTGEWGYHNHVRANDFGKVMVE